MAQVPQGSLKGPAKLEAVRDLMNKLTEDLKSISLLPHQRDAALEELKVYGRDPTDADPVFTREGIETLTRHAFNSPSNSTARNALRCLCNALFLKPNTRQMFVDLGFEAKACNRLKNDNRDDEFLVSRLIFLTTYDTNIDLAKLIDQHHLAETIVHNLARHAKHCSVKASSKATVDAMEDVALVETLKLLFNVTHFAPQHVHSFTPAIPHIMTIMVKRDLPAANAPLAPPFGPLVNALINLKVGDKDIQSTLSPKNEPTTVSERLTTLLELALNTYKDDELEQTVTPLVSIIASVHEHAPGNVRQFIRDKLLPTEEDRHNVLGRSDSLSAKLLRNSTNPMTPQLREAISHLLFDMSDKDSSKFVQNVGYGFASGFLFQNNMPIPETASEAFSTESGDSAQRPVNPVTGQFLDSEKLPEAPEMTQEEKEREAERLYVLFERLKKTGIVNVENPVEKAFREGRVQELDDDDDLEELD